jgi:hypothetical protein
MLPGRARPLVGARQCATVAARDGQSTGTRPIIAHESISRLMLGAMLLGVSGSNNVAQAQLPQAPQRADARILALD